MKPCKKDPKRGRKQRTEKVKPRANLTHGAGKYPPEEVKNLWDEYRIGKFYACMGDMLDMFAAYKLKDIGEYKYEENRRHPAQGSAFWVECIQPPLWFYEEELR